MILTVGKTYSFCVDSVHNRCTPYKLRLRKRKRYTSPKERQGAKPHLYPASRPRWTLNSKWLNAKGYLVAQTTKKHSQQHQCQAQQIHCPQGQQARSFLGATPLVGGEGKLAGPTQHPLPAPSPAHHILLLLCGSPTHPQTIHLG